MNFAGVRTVGRRQTEATARAAIDEDIREAPMRATVIAIGGVALGFVLGLIAAAWVGVVVFKSLGKL